MNKYLLSTIIMFSLLTSVSLTFAETTSTNPGKVADLRQKISDVKQNMQTQRETMRADMASSTMQIKNIRQEIKDAVEIRIGKKLNEQKTKFANEFENAIKNENDLIMRAQSRISVMAQQNIDVASSSALLEKAKTQLSLAGEELAKLENLLTQNIPSATSTDKTTRNSLLQSIKAQSEKIKVALKTAHASIVDVIASLKIGLMRKESTSTSTKN